MGSNDSFRKIFLIALALLVIIAISSFLFFQDLREEDQEKELEGNNKSEELPKESFWEDGQDKDDEESNKDRDEDSLNDLGREEVDALPGEKIESEDSTKEELPKIVIIIDDLGYNLELNQELYELNQPLTLAILPFKSYTKETVTTFENKDNFELILHLPLEPFSESQVEKNMITVDMSKDEIVSFLDASLEDVDNLMGLNNHKGSKFTSDELKMKELLEELRTRNLFFVDSYTIANSVGYSLSKEMGIPTVKRDVFLDYSDDKDLIKEELLKIEAIARENGIAVAIGHHRKNTIEVLKQELPEMEKRGIELITVSDALE